MNGYQIIIRLKIETSDLKYKGKEFQTRINNSVNRKRE